MAELYNYKVPVPVIMCNVKKQVEILVLQVRSLGDFLPYMAHYLYFYIRYFYSMCVKQCLKKGLVFLDKLR